MTEPFVRPDVRAFLDQLEAVLDDARDLASALSLARAMLNEFAG